MSITPPRTSRDYGNRGPVPTTNGPTHSEFNYYGMTNDAFENEMREMAARGARKQPKPDGPITKCLKDLVRKVFK